MINNFESLIAIRYILSRRKEGFISLVTLLSLIGIAIGVAALIIVMSVMVGFRNELVKKIIGIDGDIEIYSYSDDISHYDQLIKSLKNDRNIIEAIPVIEKQGLLTNDYATKGTQVRAISKEFLQIKNIRAGNLLDEELIKEFDGNKIILGVELLNEMGVNIGDEIKLLVPSMNQTIIGGVPRFKTFEILGTFRSSMSQYNNSLVFIPIHTGEILYQVPSNNVNVIEVYSKNPEFSDLTLLDVAKITDNKYQTIDWKAKNKSFLDALKVERVSMFSILTMITIIAVLNIISGLVMLVKDKEKDIAILRTIGATRGAIIKIFLLSGLIIGISGAFAGVLIGVLFVKNIQNIKNFLESFSGIKIFDPVVYFLDVLPAELNYANILEIALMAIGFSFLATLYPAWKAAKIEPGRLLG